MQYFFISPTSSKQLKNYSNQMENKLNLKTYKLIFYLEINVIFSLLFLMKKLM